MNKLTAVLTALVCLLGGIIIGFLISPVKHGMGNNSGNKYYYYKKDEAAEE